ncbi:MAG TPA: BON domain-containing protein [Lacipirellula sp.]
MAHPISFLTGAGFGAGMMYFYDPDCGNRRRSLIRDQLIHACAVCERGADVLRRDASNRMHGIVAEVQSAMHREPPTDEVLAERVRARIGRVVSHPRAIEVESHDGCVRLSGPVLAHEVQNLVDNVRWVRGVQQVENNLDVHQEAGNISALQGGVERHYQPLDIFQDRWSPTTKAAMGLAAVGLMTGCAINRSLGSMVLGTLGFGMAVQAASRAVGGNSMARGSIQQRGQRGNQQQFEGQSAREPRQAGADQAADLPQRAEGARSAEWPEGSAGQHNAGAENQRSVTGQSGEPAIHNL